MSHTPSIPAPPASISDDLPCMSCRYNLRALPPTSRCPECGTPIPDSLTHHARAKTLNIKALSRAALCLSLLPLLEAFFHSDIYSWLCSHLIQIDFVNDLHFQWLPPLLLSAIAFLAIYYLTVVQPLRHAKTIQSIFLAWPLLNILLIPLILWTNDFWFTSPRPILNPFAPFCGLSLAAFRTALTIPFYLVVLFLLHRFAARLQRPWLATLAAWSFSLCIISNLLQAMSLLGSLEHWWYQCFTDAPYFLYEMGRYSDPLAKYFLWPAIVAPFLYSSLFAVFIRRAAIHAPPPQPWGWLIDPASAIPPPPDNPARFTSFRLACLRAGTIAFALVPLLALADLLPLPYYPRSLFGIPRVAQMLFSATLLAAFASLAFLITCRRHPTRRHYFRAAATLLVALAAVVCQFRPALCSLLDPTWLFHYPGSDVLPGLLLLALLLAAQAFFLNLARQTNLPRLAAWTLLAPTLAFSLLLLLVAHLAFAKIYLNPPFAFLDRPWHAILTAALALLFLYAAFAAYTLLRPTRPKSALP